MDISDIFIGNVEGYLKRYGDRIPKTHLKAIDAIVTCRTAFKGGTTFKCEKCGEIKYSYHSCKNRHCPKCGSHDSTLWLEKQSTRLLPVNYHLTTFTIPSELRNICRSNQKLFYTILFKASSYAFTTLLSDPKYAGGCPGFISILHTWSRTLDYHPHVHCVVAGGAYDVERNKWNKAGGKFLVPVKALSKIFRAKFGELLKIMNKKLYYSIHSNVFFEKEFVTHSTSVGKGESALKYLAEYVFKVAISNNRIVGVKDGKVSFRYVPSGTNENKIMSLDTFEFMRRYLQHVLPDGFQKVRGYGFMSPAAKKTTEALRSLLSLGKSNTNKAKKHSETEKKNKIKEHLCPWCKSIMIKKSKPKKTQRAPPKYIKPKKYYIERILRICKYLQI